MTIFQRMTGVLKGLIFSYIITVVLLFAIAVVVYKVGISDSVLNILVVLVYIVSTFVGGIITGKAVQEKRFAWGAVFGISYMLIIIIVSMLWGGGADEKTVSCIARSIMCIAGGMLGAMLS
ncbi:MAG: TIGR04086 family membrane protein [Clostridiales bacterium]|nr:TIGR04086 family membrane protein [Clostridiales bacterium]